MSWILQDLWRELEARQSRYSGMLATSNPMAFVVINEVAARVGQRWGLTLQVNLPAGGLKQSPKTVAHNGVSMLVDRGRKKFLGVTALDVEGQLKLLGTAALLPAEQGYEGYRATLNNGGTIVCLPGAVHLWCNISPNVLEFLDWLFVNAYGAQPASKLS